MSGIFRYVTSQAVISDSHSGDWTPISLSEPREVGKQLLGLHQRKTYNFIIVPQGGVSE